MRVKRISLPLFILIRIFPIARLVGGLIPAARANDILIRHSLHVEISAGLVILSVLIYILCAVHFQSYQSKSRKNSTSRCLHKIHHQGDVSPKLVVIPVPISLAAQRIGLHCHPLSSTKQRAQTTSRCKMRAECGMMAYSLWHTTSLYRLRDTHNFITWR